MKEINGTVTLAFVEEDNKQRVIFRVIPLCTREGSTFHGGAEEFPDEGSLRIVPDKREQSTFKERMREIGGLCVIQLSSDGKELMKVRQNRNYAPDQGEKNQYAIYSDVVCEFTPEGCYEVIEAGMNAEKALTANVLIHKNKMLYGPVAREAAQTAAVEQLKAFGNERFLLHAIEAPQVGGRHQICWDPEATLNWRQRRNSLRRKDRGERAQENTEVKAAAETAVPEEKTAKDKAEEAHIEKLKKMDPHSRRVERSAEILRQQEEEKKQAAKAEKTAARKAEKEKNRPSKEEKPVQKTAEKEPETETALPIGTHLEILDSDISFEQQISRLAQPLSEGANRLTDDTPAVAEEEVPETVTAHFNGTPLSKNSGKPIRSKTRPENVHHVVEQQLMGQRDEVMGSELGSGTYGMIRNPIESLRSCLEYVWQNVDMREQAMEMLMANEAFVADVADALRKGGVNLHVSAAAQEQLAEIEADRLSLLMQLEMAKENTKKYREEAIARAAQKKRDEVERLKNEIKQLEQTRRKLAEASKVLSSENAKQVTDFMSRQLTCMSGAAENRVMVSPVLGREYTHKELAEQLRVHMNASGFSISEDDAMSTLIAFSLYDAVCFRARTLQDAHAFARVLLESFGLQSVSADVSNGVHVELISLLGENTSRTPTVTVQLMGTETMTVFGHKTIFLADEKTDMPSEQVLPFPVVQVPVMHKRAFANNEDWTPVEPAALSSFAGLSMDSHPMLSEAEKWFSQLRAVLKEENVRIPDNMITSMRRFIEVASRKVRGGFVTAADMAVCHWVVPMLLLSRFDRQHMMETLAGLPKAMDQLGMN